MSRLPDTQWICAFALLGAVLTPTLGLADTSRNTIKVDTETLFEFSLEALLDVNVSSPTLTPQSIRTTPASVTLITRSQIDKSPYRYLHEILNHVPGFQTFRQAEAGNEVYHSARGRRVGTSSREVLILIDGVRINREADNAQAIPSILLDHIEKIELIRGPGSSIYGSNAFMGVISISTRQGENRVQVDYSNLGLTHLASAITHTLNDWQLSLNVSIEDDPGDHYLLENPFDQQRVRSDDENTKADIHLTAANDSTTIQLGKSSRQSAHYYVVENLHPRNTTQNTFTTAALKHHFTIGEQWDWYANLMLTKAIYNVKTALAPEGFAQAYGGSQPASSVALEGDAFQEETSNTLGVWGNWAFSTAQSVQLGAEYRQLEQNAVESYYNYDLTTVPIIYVGSPASAYQEIAPADDSQVRGVFVQYQARFYDNLNLTLGVRYDKYSHLDPAYSPRSALVWNVNASHTLKLIYGEAFRAPSTNEKWFSDNAVIRGNINLKPETIRTTEVNWIYSHQKLCLNASVYSNTINNSIEQGFEGATRTFINQQSPSQFGGYEFELTLPIHQYANIRMNYSKIIDLPESQMRQADEFAGLIFDYHRGDWQWNLSGVYAGARSMRVASDTLTLGGYSVWSTKLQYALSPAHSVALGITNMSDEAYLTPTQGQTLQQGLPNRGRAFFMRYDARF